MADKIVQPDKDSKPVSGETAAAMKGGGESGGDAYPNEAATGDKPGGFDGGKTDMGYHGTGQLGDKPIGEGDQNAPAKSKD